MTDKLFENVGKDANAIPEDTVAAKPETVAPAVDEVPEKADTGAGQPDELSLVKTRAKLMGVQFSNNIGLEPLKAKIAEHQKGDAKKAELENAQAAFDEQEEAAAKAKRVNVKTKSMNLRAYLQKEKMRLVRLRITNLDPKKKDLPGEILTTGNEFLGTVRKFVPFGEPTDDGFHVPYCLYEMMRDRKFLSIKTRKDRKGQLVVEQQWVREFALEVLPALTETELATLQTAQLASGSLER